MHWITFKLLKIVNITEEAAKTIIEKVTAFVDEITDIATTDVEQLQDMYVKRLIHFKTRKNKNPLLIIFYLKTIKITINHYQKLIPMSTMMTMFHLMTVHLQLICTKGSIKLE